MSLIGVVCGAGGQHESATLEATVRRFAPESQSWFQQVLRSGDEGNHIKTFGSVWVQLDAGISVTVSIWAAGFQIPGRGRPLSVHQ